MKRLLGPVIVLSFLLPSVVAAKPITRTLDLHIYERFRLTSWDNVISMEDEAGAGRTFTRHKTLIGVTWQPSKQVTSGLTFGNEFRYQINPVGLPFTWNEIFIDQLYVRYQLPISPDVSVTVGRQNMMFGEGFIVMDGGPLDGSRSRYFDAIRADWKFRGDHSLTAFYCNQLEEEQRLPLINDQNQPMIEQPEEGFGLHFTQTVHECPVEAYVIHKNVRKVESNQKQLSVTAVGVRAAADLGKRFRLTIEPAHQFGDQEGQDLSAWGGHGYVRYTPEWKNPLPLLPAGVELGGIYLSGDDPTTPEFESWDPMFARWPKWSEGYIYSQVREKGVAWWSNFTSLYARLDFQLGSSVKLDLRYHHLLADHPAEFDTAGSMSVHRGELIIGKLSYSFNQLWSGHIYVEGFNPDDFYAPDADSYVWIRTELLFRY